MLLLSTNRLIDFWGSGNALIRRISRLRFDSGMIDIADCSIAFLWITIYYYFFIHWLAKRIKKGSMKRLSIYRPHQTRISTTKPLQSYSAIWYFKQHLYLLNLRKQQRDYCRGIDGGSVCSQSFSPTVFTTIDKIIGDDDNNNNDDDNKSSLVSIKLLLLLFFFCITQSVNSNFPYAFIFFLFTHNTKDK